MKQKRLRLPGLPAPTETPILKAIEDALEFNPYVFAWRNNTGAAKLKGFWVKFGAVGSADIIGCVETRAKLGRFFGLEVKRDDRPSRVTEAQRRWASMVRGRGGFVAVVSSVEDALRAIAEAREGKRQDP